MRAKSGDIFGSDDEGDSDASSLAAHSVESLWTSAQRSGHRGPPPRHPKFVARTSLIDRTVNPLTRPVGHPLPHGDRPAFNALRAKGLEKRPPCGLRFRTECALLFKPPTRRPW